MFANISQGLFMTGTTGYLIVVPLLRLLATVLMALSTYKLLKARRDPHKAMWIIAVLFAPVPARLVYEAYCRWLAKKEIPPVKGSAPLLIAAVAAYVLSVVVLVMSVVSMGAGYLKSEWDGEPLAVFYDVHGNAYYDYSEVPLYDKDGNIYTHEPAWFTAGTYTDQNGKAYDGDYCFLSQDGYFYYDAKDELVPYKDSYDYYTDGRTIYYYLFDSVYWEEDGTIYGFSGRVHFKLFDFDQ